MAILDDDLKKRLAELSEGDLDGFDWTHDVIDPETGEVARRETYTYFKPAPGTPCPEHDWENVSPTESQCRKCGNGRINPSLG